MKWGKIRWLTYMLVVVGLVAYWRGWWVPNAPSVSRYPVRGIDVSHHNGEVRWDSVGSEGIDFVFIKATEGADWQDPRFRSNWDGAQGAGLKVGAYHFFRTTSSGADQAMNFIATVPRLNDALPPVIDLEFSRESAVMKDDEFFEQLEVMRGRLREYYGVDPIIYTVRGFYDDYLTGIDVEHFWLRSTNGEPDWASDAWVFWQYTDRGRVRGIEGQVDLNVYRGDLAELEAMLIPGR
ncbi:GH25 family lysozyme [Sulfuriroseicoccus oceanibius]|uniref:Uncharacterized protein n=1 Tax=Sulfuriroseicoccus oceanibius TaxID=2707525 RepID=A0A6B3LFD9_9BACT|nr:GH25 family lysozyme [Sulfuriroseicoccus oceanibius]QQL44389.1 hypothetical protein G3M56_010905 [Sulfuriroseicoccus oceanibius]